MERFNLTNLCCGASNVAVQYTFDVAEDEFAFIHKSLFTGKRGRPCMYDDHNDRFFMYGPGVVLDRYIVHVVINHDICVTVRARTRNDLVDILDKTCEGCDFPRPSCVCPSFVNRNGHWDLRCSNGRWCRYNLKNYVGDTVIFADYEFGARSHLQGFTMDVPDGAGTFVKVVEDIGTLVFQLKNSRSHVETSVAIGAFVRSVTGVSATELTIRLSKMFNDEFSKYFMLQSDSWCDSLEMMWSNYEIFKKSTLGTKVVKVLGTIVCQCLFVKMGVEIDEKRFIEIEQKKIRPSLLNCVQFVDALGSLIIFCLKQGRQYMITGDLNCFFISGESVGDWVTKSRRIKANFEFLSNPSAVNMDVHVYLKELSDAIRDGQSIVKALRFETAEWKITQALVIELETIEKRYMCLAAALSMRRCPLGIVFFGTPGIGKSHLTDLMCKFLCEVLSLDPDVGYRFYHSSEEEYFTNHKTYMHTVIMDDVAQHKPEKIQGVDPSMSTAIKINNNMPFCPPQAAIDDKGKTPMMNDITIITTNVRDMNIHHYYEASYAVMRRFPVHIEPIVKPAYRKENSNALDDAKTGDNQYADYWDFIIREPREGENQHGTYQVVKHLKSLKELFEYVGPIARKHDRNQRALIDRCNRMELTQLCGCGIPLGVCNDCQREPQLQMDVEEHDDIPMQEDLFRAFPDWQDCPWRLNTRFGFVGGQRRPFNIRMLRNFIDNMKRTRAEHEWEAIEHYGSAVMPDLLRNGWRDIDIREDFEAFMTYANQHAMFRTEFENLGRPLDGSLWQKFTDLCLKILFYCYFEFQICYWCINYTLGFSPLRRMFLSGAKRLVDMHRTRKRFLERAGEQFDNVMGGQHPFVKLIVPYLGYVSMCTIMASALAGVYYAKRDYGFYNSKVAQEELKVESDKKFEECAEQIDANNKAIIDVIMVEKTQEFFHQKDKGVITWEEIQDFYATLPSVAADELYSRSPHMLQGVLKDFGSLPIAAPNDDKRNVWIKEDRIVTSADFCPKIGSCMSAISTSLNRSSVNMELEYPSRGGKRKYIGHCIIIDNENIIINNHAIPENVISEITIFIHARGVKAPRFNFSISEGMIKRIPNRDLCFVRTKAIPMLYGNNIHHNIPLNTFEGTFDGFYHIRKDDGTFKQHPVYDIHQVSINRQIDEHHFNGVCYTGRVIEPTSLGDCGSFLIMNTGFGPVVVGFHFLYDPEPGRVYAVKLTHEEVVAVKSPIQIQCGIIDTLTYDLVDKDKSYIDFHDEYDVIYHGELNVSTVRSKTSIVKTEICDYLQQLEGFEDFKFEKKFSKPLMHSWRPQQLALYDYIHPTSPLNEIKLANCAQVLLKKILDSLPESELKLIKTCSFDVAINGMPGMAYVDGIKRSTSMGYPYMKSKKHFLEPLDGMWDDGVTFNKEARRAVSKLLKKYINSQRGHPIANATLKDEVVTIEKYQKGKTRVFFSCPHDFLIVIRMMFLNFTRVMQRNWKRFFCVIGVNCHGPQWNEIYRILTRYQNYIAGDFESFDKKFKVVFMRFAFWIIKSVCIASKNFSDEEIIIMEAIEADLTNPTVNWFGMLITLLHGKISGHGLTTPENCFCCILYLMYAFCHYYDIKEFFDNVEVFSLGDDHVGGVSDKCPDFNHCSIKHVLTSIGVGYTMAEKEREVIPYIDISEVTFLKRTFRYHESLGMICAPLEKQSINKMLTYHEKKKTCSESEALAQALVSASMEAFYHGRAFFDYLNQVIDEMPKSTSLLIQMENYPRFTWEENVRRFLEEDVRHSALVQGRSQNGNFLVSYCISPTALLQGDVRMGRESYFTRAFPEVHFYGRHRLKPEVTTKDYWNELSSSPYNYQLAETNQNMSDQSAQSVGTTGQMLNMDLNNPAPTREEDQQITDVHQETSYFVNEKKPEILDLTTKHDPTADLMLIQADLRNFLSRPAKIFSTTWNIGDPAGIIGAPIQVWKLYFNVQAVKNKLLNFKFIRCNLHLKIVINASPFYYGALGAFYNPLATHMGDTTGSALSYVPGQQVLVSQRNHVWLDPQTVSTQEMVLPFLYWYNFVDCAQIQNIGDLGNLELYQYSFLRSANGVVAGGVTINIYAWAEDVQLSGTTARPMLQGRSEFKPNGQISGMASTVSTVARKLKEIPFIEPFASATERVSDIVGGVASFFGFSNVPVIEDVKPFKSLPFHTLASSEISEPINKLSLQPKQETSVGMYFGDAGLDPLVISNFVQRESFLCGCGWSTTHPEDSVLFVSAVTPELFEYKTGPNQWYSTPMNYASSFFQYWSGDIIFRFKVIKSKYHRGRLNFCWDVGCTAANNMPAVGDPAAYNVIMDLDQEDEVEMRIPYTQAAPFLNLTYFNTGAYWANASGATFTGLGNGFIEMRVINALTAPVSTSDVTILVFVRGADNLEFSGPRNMVRDKTLLALQGKVIEINQTGDQDSNKFKENFGERILSFRELLHRQSKTATQVIPKNVNWAGTQMIATFPLQRLPRTYGYHSNGWEVADSTLAPGTDKNFNFVRNHPVNWLTRCFIGYKGSVNYNVNVTSQASTITNPASYISVTRRSDVVGADMRPRAAALLSGNSTSQLMKDYNTDVAVDTQGAAGMALTNQYTQAGLAVNLPYYSRSKFLVSNLLLNYPTSTTAWEVEKDTFDLSVKKSVTLAGTTDGNMVLDIMYGTGPDFDVIYFLNCPPVIQLTPPTPKATG